MAALCEFELQIIGKFNEAATSKGSDGDGSDCPENSTFLDELRVEICEKHGSVENYLDHLLDSYIQSNYLGPVASEAASDTPGSVNKKCQAYLQSVCSEPVSVKSKHLHCLALGQFIVDSLLLPAFQPMHCLYSARLISLLQDMLEDKAPALHKRLMSIVENGVQLDDPDDDLTSSPEAVAKFERYFEHQLLLAQLCLAYFESRHAIRIVTECQARLGLTASLSGAAGVRTRFQQTSHAQLYLSIDARHAGLRDYQAELETSGSQLPRDVAPTDDTLLPTVKFSETDSDAELARLAASNLSPVEQVCLLAASDCHRRSRASDGIIEEELLAYANALLIRPTSWSATAAALLRRSRIELGLLGGSGGSGGASSRRLERALHQLEELSNQLAKPDPEFYPFRRRLFFACSLPPVWRLQLDLADALAAVGAVSSALDIYLRWDSYSQIIACYQKLDKPALAEKIIRDRLAESETPELYCALAEVTRDWNHLHTAWRLSNGRCARAARSLGYVAMVAGQYAEAMRQFELALAANHLQPKAWFTYGCCCLQAGEIEKAELAFRRSAQLEPDNYEAWTNLGTAMVRRGNKIGACSALREALKSNWEQWRVWDNYLAVCADTGQFNEAMRAYHRLLELRPKYWDPHSAGVLIRAASSDEELIEDSAAREDLRRRLLTLFARVAAQSSGDAEFWWLYAKLLSLTEEGETGKASLNAELKGRILQTLQKCHRCDTQQSDWFKSSADNRDRVLNRAADIAQRYLDFAEDCPQSLLSARLMLTGLLARRLEDGPPMPPPPAELMQRLREQLESINSLLKPAV
ncbi:hypothetical protein BOX15_Mlig011823g2 [Macrostomum lignano]|uniref:Uncharacterized protein n=1 Tax=Macrostomum lignano TaxID=282301 RepID=A0A267GGQ1_9PLAT|nr:hypothetical protein BOX15_Mlig011823g2 [Macrostomum lignano]